MTDDTDSAECEGAENAVSLPLLDAFAALEAELTAKEDRIERLENELAADFLDPDGAEQPPDEGAAATDQGASPTAKASATRVSADQEPDGEPTAADVGPQPVRTASADSGDGATSGSADERSEATPDEQASEFGVTRETRSNLTGGSLASSPGPSGKRDSPGSDDTNSASREDEPHPDPTADRGERLSHMVRRAELPDEEEVVQTFVRGIDALDDVTRGMLAHYREVGDAVPVEAHVAAGGSGERQYAYARNRTLRKAGLIEHDGAGRYHSVLPDLVEEAFDGHADGETLTSAVSAIESGSHLDA